MLIAPHEYPSDQGVAALAGMLDEQVVLDACRMQLTRGQNTSNQQNWCVARRIETLYHPNRYVRVVYVLLSNTDTPASRYWPTGQLVYLHAPVRESISRRGEVIRIDGQDVEAYLFPNDRRLRGVRHFAGRESCIEVWQQWLNASGNQATLKVDTLQRLLVRYVPEQKWIVRLRAELDGWSDHRGSNKKRIAIRAGSPESIDKLARRHQALAEPTVSTGPRFLVPDVVGTSHDNSLLGVEWIRGHHLIDAIKDQGCENILLGIATRLHTLHTHDIVGLERITRTDIAQRIGTCCIDLATAYPTQQSALTSIRRLWEHMFLLTGDAAEAIGTVHNDFHWNQLSIKRDRYALFDLERMANADPLLDVANFASQLLMLGYRPESGVKLSEAQRWQDMFLANWQEVTGESIDRARLKCYAALSKLDLARGMMRHLRPGWKNLADRCIQLATEDVKDR